MTQRTSTLAASFRGSALWCDALGMPAAMRRTLELQQGFEQVAAALREPRIRRVLVTGNGAAYYVAQAAASASLGLSHEGSAAWLAIPAGLLLSGGLRVS
jgi:fructoselysine-6-P-deglycase FrlB-like protein